MDKLKQFFETFSNISEQNWCDLKSIFVETKLLKGEYFAEDGIVCKKFGVLKNGLMRGFYRDENGSEYNKTFFQSPSFIGGYSSLITGKQNEINQQALTDCEVFWATYSDFEHLCKNNFELERLSKNLAQRHFVEKEKREIEMIIYDANIRYEIFQAEFPELEKFIPQYHIASYLGITPTQLSRIRKKIKSLHM